MIYIIVIFAIWLYIHIIVAVTNALSPTKKKKKSARPKHRQAKYRNTAVRTDAEILKSRLQDMSGAEFERLLALYFSDQGYIVHEVGIGGNDGGVDLVIIDKKGYKTAIQAKCYRNQKVPVQTVRELVAAKRNHGCILSMLITTSDLTAVAKQEAENFKIEYWHGAILERKLKAWGMWRGYNKRKGT